MIDYFIPQNGHWTIGHVTNRAGSGHYFYGPGRVSGLWFWPGSGSGYWKTPTGWFRAKKAKETKIRANFGLTSGQLRAISPNC